MAKYIYCLFSIFLMLAANPQIVTIINEFQTIASGNDIVEFHSTWLGGYSLLNVPVTTIAGTALIDTNIILDYGYVIIDNNVLSGPFYLPADTGYIIVYVDFWFQDSIFYPFYDSVPNSTASASKYYRWVGEDIIDQYRVEDWYIDYSPTLGLPNDDYPGCKVSGTVYCESNLIPNASVVAASVDSIHYNPESLLYHIKTFTSANGSYSFDHLFPLRYVITVSAEGYESRTDTTPRLHAMQPLANFDFNLNSSAITVNNNTMLAVSPKISANPFVEEVTIDLCSSAVNEKYSVRIFDISCRLVRYLSIRSNRITWNGRDECGREVNPGIYFVFLPDNRIKLIKL